MADSTDPNTPNAGSSSARGDPRPELRKLLELSAKYPDIGPPVAELAHKVGCADIGEQIVRLGLDRDTPGVEFYFVTAHVARREGRSADARKATLDALEAFTTADDEARADDEANRLLHLIRLGFATLMFDDRDVRSDPEFSRQLASKLPRLEDRLGSDPFYRSLLAQALWIDDPEKSEAEWERAAEIDASELAWNARGTWYKEAERDPDKAERTYRRGLEAVPHSALLMHNLAQILVDKATAREKDPPAALKLLGQAEELLRTALREDAPKVRRHIHATRDRLHALRRSLPKPRQQQGQKRGNAGKGPPQKSRASGGGGGGGGMGSQQPQQSQQRRRNRGGGGGGHKGRESRPGNFQSDGRIRLGDVLLDKLNKQKQSDS